MTGESRATAARLAAFAIGLVLVFVAALGLGRWAGPAIAEPAQDDHGHGDGGGHDAMDMSAGHPPGGLQVSEEGYTLVLDRTRFTPGTRSVSFTIDGPDGAPVTSYRVQHTKELHLIAVRRDFTGFQHVHPARAADGTWSAPLDLTPGTWRLYADFATGEHDLTLGTDLIVAGTAEPAPGSVPVRRVAHTGGYQVVLTGDLRAGQESELSFRVTRAERPVGLEPYLGARGHLVALREGDLAYLHVHPTGADRGVVRFAATVPTVSRYRLYLDVKVDGVVRTASFVLTAGAR